MEEDQTFLHKEMNKEVLSQYPNAMTVAKVLEVLLKMP
jgi:hypothetical protein